MGLTGISDTIHGPKLV